MNYQYPIQVDWSTKEIIDVIAFFEVIEKAYESSVQREQLMSAYRRFKQIVPSMSEEKKLFKEFEESSGYNSYRIVKAAKEAQDGEFIKG